MADDIIQRIIIQAVDQATATVKSIGNNISQTAQQLAAPFQQFGQTAQAAFSGVANTAATAGNNIKSVFSGLGSSLASVGSVISSFTQSFAQAFGSSYTTAVNQGTQAVKQNGQALEELSGHATSAHGALRVLTTLLRDIPGGAELANLAHVLGLVGLSFGAVAAAAAGVVLAVGAAAAAAISASDNVRALGRASDVTGESFTRLSQTAEVFRGLGVSVDQFANTFQQLGQRLSSMAPELAAEWAAAGDKITTALLNVEDALLKIQQTKLDASNLQIAQQQIALQGQQLQLQAQSFNFQRQQLALQGSQLANNLGQVQLQLQYSGQQFDIQQRQSKLTVQDAQANLQKLLLQRQLRDGNISEEEFANQMAAIDDAALNRAIKKAKVDLDAAKLAEQMLPAQQALQLQALQLQAQQIELQAAMLPLLQAQLDLARQQNALDEQKNQNAGTQNQLDIQRNIVEAQRDQVTLNRANSELIKAQANDLRNIVGLIKDAAEAGKEVKFPELTTAETKAKAFAIALLEAKTNGTGLAEALEGLLRSLSDVDKFNVAKSLGIPQDIIDAYKTLAEHGRSLADAIGEIQAKGGGFTDQDRANLKEVQERYDTLKGSIAEAKDQLGAFAAVDTAKVLGDLKSGLEAATKSADALVAALGKLGQTQLGDLGLGSIVSTITGAISKALSFLGTAKSGLLGMIFDALIPKAGAAEADSSTNALSQAIADAINKAIKDAANQLDVSGIAQVFTGLGDKIREAIGTVDLTAIFSGITDQAREAADQIIQAFNGIGTRIQEVFGAIDLSSVFANLGDVANQVFSQLVELVRNVAIQIVEIFSNMDISSSLSSQIDRIIDKFNQLAQAAAAAAQAAQQAANAGGGGDSSGLPFASGGLFRGRGGIDTNLAWLSDGEFIVRADAVRRYGLGLLHAINSMQFPINGFALGGLAAPRFASIPAFAGGGLNTRSAQRVLNLTIEGKTFGGLSVPENTAQALERFAISSQIASAGRKQSWRR